MKKYFLSMALAFAATATFAAKGDTELKGYIDDSHCAAMKTPMCTEATRGNCVNMCMKTGATAVLVSGGKVYKIANQKSVLKFAGKKVVIDGKVNNDTIEVTKVSEDKAKA